eukprot:g8915.t1
MYNRSTQWENALSSWSCPTPEGDCDPCGETPFGQWEHMHCRGLSPGKDGDGTVDGWLTNIHISDMRVDGPVPRELCLFPELRELDLDGGRLTGPIPEFLSSCFIELAELDMSYNRLSGTLPASLAKLETLQEIEFGYNRLVGRIPEDYGKMPVLRQLELDGNQLTGKLPEAFKGLNETITSLLVSNNDLEGDLSVLAGTHLMGVAVHGNSKLCGLVPASVRYAHGYDPSGTNLGLPC